MDLSQSKKLNLDVLLAVNEWSVSSRQKATNNLVLTVLYF